MNMLLKLELVANSFEEMKSKIAVAFAEVQKDDSLKDCQEFIPGLAPEVDVTVNASVACPVVEQVTAPTNIHVLGSTTGQERDCRGIPHDTRIHSMEGSKNKDGSWRNKRGIDKAVITQIESELKGAAPAVVATVLPPAPLPPTTSMVNEAPTFAVPQPVQAPVVQAPTVVSTAIQSEITPAPALPLGKPAHSLITFKNNLMDVFAQFINEGKITQEYVDQLVTYFAKTNPQVKNIWNILGSEIQCIEMFNIFVKAGWITRVEG